MKRYVEIPLVGLAALIVSGADTCNLSNSTSSNAAPSASSTSAPSTSAPATPTVAPTVLFSDSGSGTKTTATFTVPGEWTLDWTYDCSNFGQSGNFQVYTYNSDASLDFSGPIVNELNNMGSGTTYGHSDSGKKYLTVNSECNWTVKIMG